MMNSIKRYLWFNNTGYTSVQHNTHETQDVASFDDEKQQPQKNPGWVRDWKIILPIILVTAVTSIGLLASSHSWNGRSGGRQQYPCGNSSREALALGCSFDHLTWSWYPPYCPHYTNELFRNATQNSLRYYKSLGSEEPIEEGDLLSLVEFQSGVWVQKGEHLTHCVYMLLAQAQILRDGTRHTSNLVQYEHLDHCVKYVLESMRRDPDWNQRNSFTGQMNFDQDC